MSLTATLGAPASKRKGRLVARIQAACVAVGFWAAALFPATAILTLIWFVRVSRRQTARQLVRIGAVAPTRAEPTWRADAAVAFALIALGALVGLPLAVSWWAGWDASFNKSAANPVVWPGLALLGLITAGWVYAHLPIAFAHAAATGQPARLISFGATRALMRRRPWEALALSLATVLATAPLTLIQMLPTFIEAQLPTLTDPEALRRAWFGRHMLATAYLVTAVLLLRLWGARLLARILALAPVGQSSRWQRWSARLAFVLGMVGWIAAFASLYVIQFAGFAWPRWFMQPILGLPWLWRV
jgi:hypothetical protein